MKIVLLCSLFEKRNRENSFGKAMLNPAIEFIPSTERFNNPLFIMLYGYSFHFLPGLFLYTPGFLLSVLFASSYINFYLVSFIFVKFWPY